MKLEKTFDNPKNQNLKMLLHAPNPVHHATSEARGFGHQTVRIGVETRRSKPGKQRSYCRRAR